MTYAIFWWTVGGMAQKLVRNAMPLCESNFGNGETVLWRIPTTLFKPGENCSRPTHSKRPQLSKTATSDCLAFDH
eukprot:6366843-Amphidinium_carterae.1